MKERRIGNAASFFLIFAAVLADSLQALIDLLAFIPLAGVVIAFLLGIFVDICIIFLFAIWFSHLHVPLMNRYPLEFLATLVLENVPIVNTAPVWTWFVVKTIAQERLRERLESGSEQPGLATSSDAV